MKALQLPFHFEIKRLLSEINALPSEIFTEIKSNHINPGGLLGAPMLVPDLERAKKHQSLQLVASSWLQKLPYLSTVLDTFQSEKALARIHKLQPGAHIQRHTDGGRNISDGIFRVHVPVVTGKGAEFELNGTWLNMQAGECWFVDVSQPHEVRNAGATERIHLVIDCVRNVWWDEVFERQGGDLQLAEGAFARRTLADLEAMLDLLQHNTNATTATTMQAVEAEIARRATLQSHPQA